MRVEQDGPANGENNNPTVDAEPAEASNNQATTKNETSENKEDNQKKKKKKKKRKGSEEPSDNENDIEKRIKSSKVWTYEGLSPETQAR